MNHLGHVWVARRSGTSVLGNLLGDFVHGDPSGRFDAFVVQGIRLHRKVDTYTDAHPAFARTRARLRPELRRYAGVVVDILWDHVLARDWPDFDPEPLRDVADGILAELTAADAILPARLRSFAAYARATDVFVGYGTRAGMERVFQGVSRRISRENPLPTAAEELDRQGESLAEDFREFAADLRSALGPEGPLSPARLVP
ncbi:MAG: ACP phosphodiesterase [bacterium]